MLPADWNLDVSDQSESRNLDPDLNSSHSGLSQQLEGYSLIDEQVLPDS